MKVKITERGWAGHFICGHKCRFRRNTLIEGAGRRIVVSTVGCMVSERGIEQIGVDRYYETMAFEAKEEGGYIEADVSKELDFSSPWGIFAEREEDLPEYVDNVANDMHEAVVAEFVEVIKTLEEEKDA